jgi:hypothetical protein
MVAINSINFRIRSEATEENGVFQSAGLALLSRSMVNAERRTVNDYTIEPHANGGSPIV